MGKDIMNLLEILDRKNDYLLEFHKINTEEIERLNKGCIDNLENFYYGREILLNAIDKIDNTISEQGKESKYEVNKMEKKKLEEILKLKKKMVLSILDQDLVIISLVEELQNKIPAIAS